MFNKYEIKNLQDCGLPVVVVVGETFLAKDIYEIIGRERYSTTFTFRYGSETFKEYGRNVTGFAYYDFKTKTFFESASKDEIQVVDKLQIDVWSEEFSSDQKHQLKYIGIYIADLESISYLNYSHKTELHTTGEKKIPNVVELPIETTEVDVDLLDIFILKSKLNSGVRLVDFERKKIVGLLLAANDFQINVEIIEQLGFSYEQVSSDQTIWWYLYKSLDRRRKITPSIIEAYCDSMIYNRLERLSALFIEIKESNLQDLNFKSDMDILLKIVDQTIKFNPSILMLGKEQVYWDLKSYLHIALRHVKDFQLGKFKEKTSFIYKADDLSRLIEKVLICVEVDLRNYLASCPNKAFKRHGKMAIEFNGDYYNLSIEPSGRIEQFHMIGLR